MSDDHKHPADLEDVPEIDDTPPSDDLVANRGPDDKGADV